jgi:hypothetical protein
MKIYHYTSIDRLIPAGVFGLLPSQLVVGSMNDVLPVVMFTTRTDIEKTTGPYRPEERVRFVFDLTQEYAMKRLRICSWEILVIQAGLSHQQRVDFATFARNHQTSVSSWYGTIMTITPDQLREYLTVEKYESTTNTWRELL